MITAVAILLVVVGKFRDDSACKVPLGLLRRRAGLVPPDHGFGRMCALRRRPVRKVTAFGRARRHKRGGRIRVVGRVIHSLVSTSILRIKRCALVKLPAQVQQSGGIFRLRRTVRKSTGWLSFPLNAVSIGNNY